MTRSTRYVQRTYKQRLRRRSTDQLDTAARHVARSRSSHMALLPLLLRRVWRQICFLRSSGFFAPHFLPGRFVAATTMATSRLCPTTMSTAKTHRSPQQKTAFALDSDFPSRRPRKRASIPELLVSEKSGGSEVSIQGSVFFALIKHPSPATSVAVPFAVHLCSSCCLTQPNRTTS